MTKRYTWIASSRVTAALTAFVLAASACFDFEEPVLIETGAGLGGSASGADSGNDGAMSNGDSGVGSSHGGDGASGGDSASGGDGASGKSGESGGGRDGAGGGDGGSGAMNEAGSGGSAPVEIPQNGLVLWLSADVGVVDSNGVVERWEDRSAVNANATQSIVDFRPRLVQSTEPIRMIEFDGQGTSLVLPSGFADFSDGLSLFVVTRPLEDMSCASILYLGNSSGVDDISFASDHAAQGIFYRVGSAPALASEGGFRKGVTVLASVVHSPSEIINLYLNGQLELSGYAALPSVGTRSNNFLGRTLELGECDEFVYGRIGELVLYARAVDVDERVQIQDYLQRRWQCCGNATP